VSDVTVEIWQTNHQGYYDLEGYHHRGKSQLDKSGAYTFESVIPAIIRIKAVSANTSTMWLRRPVTGPS